MTIGRRFVVALTLVALLLGAPGTGLAKKNFVYVHDRSAGGGIYGWTLDKDGGLTSVAGSPFPLVDAGGSCTGNCQTMAYSTKRKILYTGGPTGVSGWTVNKDGTLTSVPGSPFSPGAGGEFRGTGVVQAGKRVFVYAASFNDGGVFVFEADPDGVLTELAGSPFASGDGATGLATNKKSVFVVNQTAGTISSYVAEKDGTLTPAPGSPYTPVDVQSIYNVSPDSKGKVIYVSDGVDAVRAFEVEKKTARLTELDTSPFAAVAGGAGVLITKKLLYAVSLETADNAVQPFKIVKKGNLEATGIVLNGQFGVATFASDKGGKKMVFAGSDGVVTSRIDSKKDGSLTPGDVEGFIAPTNPTAAALVKR